MVIILTADGITPWDTDRDNVINRIIFNFYNLFNILAGAKGFPSLVYRVIYKFYSLLIPDWSQNLIDKKIFILILGE